MTSIWDINDFVVRHTVQPIVDRLPEKITQWDCARYCALIFLLMVTAPNLFPTPKFFAIVLTMLLFVIWFFVINRFEKMASGSGPNPYKYDFYYIFWSSYYIALCVWRLLSFDRMAIWESTGYFVFSLAFLFCMAEKPKPKKKKQPFGWFQPQCEGA